MRQFCDAACVFMSVVIWYQGAGRTYRTDSSCTGGHFALASVHAPPSKKSMTCVEHL